MFRDDDKIKKALICMCIENVLFGMGKPAYERVIEKLNEDYNCYLPDCYEHPEYLREILKELYGNASKVLIESINRDLKEFIQYGSVEKFLKIINQ